MEKLSKGVTFRVTDELHKDVKIKVAQEGISLQEYLTKLIKKDLKEDDN